MFCRKCGKEISDQANFCNYCGTPVNSIQKQPQKTQLGLVIGCIVGGVIVVLGIVACGGVLLSKHQTSEQEEKTQAVIAETTETIEEQRIEEDIKSATEPEVKTTEIDNLEELKAKSKRAYGDIVLAYMANDWDRAQIAPLQGMDNTGWIEMSNNDYALVDLDQDGIEELLIYISDTTMAEMQLNIYTYVEENDAASYVGCLFPSIRVYENGYIQADYSHNQGMGDIIWPYDIYQYKKDSKELSFLGAVDSWNKEYFPEDYNGKPFPDELDENKDGNIYLLIEEDYNDVEYADETRLQEFLQEKMGDAKEIAVQDHPLDYEVPNNLGKEYVLYFSEKIKELEQEGQLDLATAYILDHFSMNNSYDFIKETSKQIDYKEEGYEDYIDQYIGSKDGVEAVEYYLEDDGAVRYCNQPLEGVTLLGIKPGDSVSYAKEQLKKYGFRYNGYSYSTGLGCESFGIYFEENNDTITEITISGFSEFAG